MRHHAVVVAREEHPDAEPGVEHAPQPPGHVEHEVLLDHAPGAARAVLVAPVTGVDDDGADARRLRRRQRRGGVRLSRGGRRWRRGSRGSGWSRLSRRRRPGQPGRRRRRRAGCRQFDHQPRRGRIDRHRRRAERAECLVEGDDERHRGSGGHRLHQPAARADRPHVQAVGVEAHDQAPWLLHDRVRRPRHDLDRDPRRRPARFLLDGDARHAKVAEHDQPRRPPHLRADARDGGQRPADGIGRHQPPRPVAHGSGGERQDLPADGRQALVERQHGHVRAAGNREGLCRAILAHGQLQQRRELVQPQHLLLADRDSGHGLPAVGAHHRIRGGRSRSLRCKACGGCRHEPDRHDRQRGTESH